jgi:hypothetical protein
MEALTTIGWLLAAVPVTFWIVWRRAAAEIRRVRDEERARTAEWQAKAERFRLTAIRLKLEIDAYRAGHAQGRDDGIRAMRAVAAIARDTAPPAAPTGNPNAPGD